MRRRFNRHRVGFRLNKPFAREYLELRLNFVLRQIEVLHSRSNAKPRGKHSKRARLGKLF